MNTSVLAPCVLFGWVALMSSASAAREAPNNPRPNILLVVADDLAYTDLGSFGSEIHTPNLDRLAKEGLRLTHFYATPSCSPTRATLLTGVDHHLAGLGTMQHTQTPAQRGQPGYEGYLNQRVVTLPTLLRKAGYQTFMTGKWHLGETADNSPAERGFDRSFALLQGGGGHFTDQGLTAASPALYREDGKLVPLPAAFYSSRFYSERMLDYLKHRDRDRPFFAYLSYTAPHWPLQAPRSSVEKYRGRYDDGYGALWHARRTRAAKYGLAELVPERDATGLEQKWQLLSPSERDEAARTMEVYAAMVDDLDLYLGDVLAQLRKEDVLDNTLVLFLSDNGAEGHDLLQALPQLRDYVAQCCNNRLDNIGAPDSYASYGPGWAIAGTALFRGFKAMPFEGGVRVPVILRYPPLVQTPGGISNQRVALEDIVPGLLDLAGVSHPGGRFRNRVIHQPSGRSFLDLLDSSADRTASFTLVRELFGRIAVWQGNWKLQRLPPPYGDNQWRLYDLTNDVWESRDLASIHPARVRLMTDIWESYKKINNVIEPDLPMSY